jgi:hypothetical protein
MQNITGRDELDILEIAAKTQHDLEGASNQTDNSSEQLFADAPGTTHVKNQAANDIHYREASNGTVITAINKRGGLGNGSLGGKDRSCNATPLDSMLIGSDAPLDPPAPNRSGSSGASGINGNSCSDQQPLFTGGPGSFVYELDCLRATGMSDADVRNRLYTLAIRRIEEWKDVKSNSLG